MSYSFPVDWQVSLLWSKERHGQCANCGWSVMYENCAKKGGQQCHKTYAVYKVIFKQTALWFCYIFMDCWTKKGPKSLQAPIIAFEKLTSHNVIPLTSKKKQEHLLLLSSGYKRFTHIKLVGVLIGWNAKWSKIRRKKKFPTLCALAPVEWKNSPPKVGQLLFQSPRCQWLV